jgi:hypothetical protein
MKQIDFHSYQEVQGQKYLGIATVNFDGVMLRYKIVNNKDGTAFFPAAASYNVGSNGVDRYISAFCIDSNMQNEILKELIMKNVGDYYSKFQKQTAALNHQTIAPPVVRDQVNVNRPVSAFQPNLPEWNESECHPF